VLNPLLLQDLIDRLGQLAGCGILHASKSLRQELCDITVAVQNRNDLQGLRFRAIDNQVRIYREGPDLGGSEAGSPVTGGMRKFAK
jgi:hypothetical protein